MLRVAAAETPSARWGGQDISAYDIPTTSPADALQFDSSQGDAFGITRQVDIPAKSKILPS